MFGSVQTANIGVILWKVVKSTRILWGSLDVSNKSKPWVMLRVTARTSKLLPVWFFVKCGIKRLNWTVFEQLTSWWIVKGFWDMDIMRLTGRALVNKSNPWVMLRVTARKQVSSEHYSEHVLSMARKWASYEHCSEYVFAYTHLLKRHVAVHNLYYYCY